VRRSRLILATLLALIAVSAIVARHRLRHFVPGWWENTGSYSGPLTRAPVAYDPSRPPSRPWHDPKRVAPPPTTYQTYKAFAINGQETDFLIYLPPGYDEPANASRRYPVIYWLHGYSAGPEYGTPFVETLDAAIRAGHVPPTIAVLPDGLYDSWFVDSVDGSQPVESVIVKDLIPHVDRTWRTIPERRARALEGFSMGGWGALHIAFKYPDLFGAVTSVSAPFHLARDFPQIHRIYSGDHAAYYADDPVTRARRNPASIRDRLRVRILCGGADDQGHFRYNRALDERLTQWQIPHQTIILPGVKHNDTEVYDRLGPGAFGFYRAPFEAARP
jgi:enterochelin esterase-like enzyme